MEVECATRLQVLLQEEEGDVGVVTELSLGSGVPVNEGRNVDVDGLSLVAGCVDGDASAFAATDVDGGAATWLSFASVYVYSAFAHVDVGASGLSFSGDDVYATLPDAHRGAFVFCPICILIIANVSSENGIINEVVYI